MFCKYCGKEIKDGSKFCTYCGKQLTKDLDEGKKIEPQTESVTVQNETIPPNNEETITQKEESNDSSTIASVVKEALNEKSEEGVSPSSIPSSKKKKPVVLIVLMAILLALLLFVLSTFIFKKQFASIYPQGGIDLSDEYVLVVPWLEEDETTDTKVETETGNTKEDSIASTVEPTPSLIPTSTPTPTAEVKKVAHVTVLIDNLHVRTAPSTDADIDDYASMTSYEVLDLVSAEGYDWAKIGDNQWIALNEGKWTHYSKE